MKWNKARKKPVEVEFREVEPKEIFYRNKDTGQIIWRSAVYGSIVQLKGEAIQTLEGEYFAVPDEDFIIRGIKGELYPIKKDIFYKTHDVI